MNVDIHIDNGRAGPVRNVQVRAGTVVTLRAVSDVAESLHVHGYDESLDLGPGERAALSFTADVQGVFEIETHESGQLVAKLTVT